MEPGKRWRFVVVRPGGLDGNDDADTLVEGKPRLTVAVADDERPGEGSSVTLELDVRTLPPVVTAITADQGLTATLLRGLPLSRLAKYATIGGLAAFGVEALRDELWSRLSGDGSGFEGFDAGQEITPPLFTFTVDDGAAAQKTVTDSIEELVRRHDGSSRSRRNIVSDELLQRVAHVYREAIKTRRPPKKAVQASEGVSEATAGRYIMRARERGLLGQTTRGKKGEGLPT